ncbi:MAG TPA: SDR family oxidoreductase [Vicinamibacteria bacterium]|jgi:NAD(P)-dependent dehydrogenase (short-subunit alcohol dehydrogenase family)|nr:SDR family oxidoreductase [Vicinamibacteria bacterium]
MSSNKLENKVALITGGTTGIGLATAKRFAEEGARVVVTGRNPETLAAARGDLDGQVEVLESDAADEDQIADLFKTIAQKHKRLDVLFLNAGIALFAPLPAAPLADFDAMWKVNVRGPWLALKHALPLLSEGAAVIVNTSVVNQKGMPGTAAYAATKAALRAIVRVASAELASRKVRVNAISPGPIDTPILGKSGLPAPAIADFRNGVPSRVPLARFGTADEVASAAVFLASGESSFISGSEIAVDGGFAQV